MSPPMQLCGPHPTSLRLPPHSTYPSIIIPQIQKIQASLQELKSTSAQYGFTPSSSDQPRRKVVKFERPDPQLGSQSIQEDEVFVGIDFMREKIVGSLVEGASTLTVVSLVGMGGLGKTTLANKVYDHEDVHRNFDRHAWINVSHPYNIKKLLLVMIEQIFPAAERIGTTRELIGFLRQQLQKKRYIVVFDDVWDVDFWVLMKEALPDNEKGSRIIITSRHSGVVPTSYEETPKAYVLQLEPLPSNIARELFCQVAFGHEFGGDCPPELEQLSTQIVEKCRGLPLLIKAIAGYLSTKEKVPIEWKRVLFYFEQSPSFISVQNIISLSYHDLPPRLKSCFLYFSIFPENYFISDVKLFRLWIAEGFIKQEGDKTLEQVAEEYLNELVQRNLVQISYVNHQGNERLCKVHDLILAMVLSKAQETRFSDIQYGESSRTEGKSSRLSICGGTGNISAMPKHFNEVCSLFLFDTSELSKAFVDTLFERCKILAIIDFENVPLVYVPNAVGNLLYLKYLSLRNTKVKILPKSVGKLENLQTLDIRNTLVKELPIAIYNLRKLQQLMASSLVEKNNLISTHGVRIKEGIGRLENLETLMTVEANERDIGCMEELEKLGKLRWLGVSRLTNELLRSLCTSIEKMSRLERLRLHSLESFDQQSISSPPLFLQSLILKGRLQMMPDWISKLQYLSVMGLSFSRLADDPLQCLHCLPNLVFLSLYHAFDGDQLHFQEGGFQKLKVLVLRELHGLKTLKIDELALPLLEDLQVGPSWLLDEVPSDIQHLGNLRVLAFYDMPRDFVLGMQPDRGSDYWKIEHIPSVVFRYRVRGRHYAVHKLGESDLLDHLQGLAGSTYSQWDEHRCSFFYSDDEDLATTSDVEWKDDHLSFFSDDIED